MNRAFACLLVVVGLVVSGCSKHEPAAAAGGHVHVAPHGGTLVEVGEHTYNLEFLRDATEGKLTVWVLDAHAEQFIRIPAPAIEFVATVGSEKKPLSLAAVANPATGEAIGNTSQFEAQAEWLKSSAPLSGTVPSLDIRGTKFENIGVKLTK